MIITQTPLRISFAGGGTDFADFYEAEGGCVLSTAIDKYIYVIIKERFDDKTRIGYSRTEMVDSIEEIEHELVRECLRLTGIESGVEISTMADIPSEGSGLGSSSSVTVGLLNAMYAYKGDPQPPRVLAEQACKIEIDVLGKPIGKQDQYIAA
ncbi:MAG: GHMP kinase, partial [Armatimonadetes bacterium]|nr:GHMP kinase [Armatimonadota bacterium]